MHWRSLQLFLAALLSMTAVKASAQGTAISYQGHLNDSGAAANTNYDFRFAVFSAPTNGTPISEWVTNLNVPVSNGLFYAKLDFGPGTFDGTANGSNDWLDVAVRLAGAASFTDLTPRQPILPVPYALFATTASNLLGTLSAAQLSGPISSTQLVGSYSNTVNFVNGTNTFAGTFIGYGAALSNLNASLITSGTLADARLQTNVALVDTNQTFTGTNAFTGPVDFKGNDTFSGTNTYLGPVAFAGTNLFSGPVTSTDSNTFTGPITSTGTNLFTGPVTFKANTAFAATNTFTGPIASTGTNTFTGINTLNNSSNYFIGSFFGNGLVGWQPVAATSTNAMRDAGYLMLNTGFSAVTLPTASSSPPLLVGDIVRVSGGGSGGWQVKVNSGQTIIGNFACYRNNIVVETGNLPGTSGGWYSVAQSADGAVMYAVADGLAGLYGSCDGGHTWNEVGSLSGSYVSVACSADGKTVYIEPTPSGTISKSTNGGLSWSTSGQPTANGQPIFCTADGTTLITGNVACSGNGAYRAQVSGGAISYSTNSGAAGSWVAISTAPSNVSYLAVSSDCSRMVAAVNNGLLYASSNLGANWTALTTTNQLWSGVWMSPDGSKIAGATVNGGSTLVTGGIYTCNVSTLPNTTATNNISGSQGAAVELQYLGNNQFMPVGSEGLIWAN